MSKSLLWFLSLFLLTQAQRECGLGVEQNENFDDNVLVEDGICQIASIGLVGCPVTQQEVRDALLETNRYQYLRYKWKDFWEKYAFEFFDNFPENLESWSFFVEGITLGCHLRAFCCSNGTVLRSLEDVLRRPDWKQRTFPEPENGVEFGTLLDAKYDEVFFSWNNWNEDSPFYERAGLSSFSARSASSSDIHTFVENLHTTEIDEEFVSQWDEEGFDVPCTYHFSTLQPTISVQNEEVTESAVETEVLQWRLNLPVVLQNNFEDTCSEQVPELTLASFSATAARSRAPLSARPSWLLLFVLMFAALGFSPAFRWRILFFATIFLCFHGAYSRDMCAGLSNDEEIDEEYPHCYVSLVGLKDSCPKTRTGAKEVILKDSFEFIITGNLQLELHRQFDVNGQPCGDCNSLLNSFGFFGLTPAGCFLEFGCTNNDSSTSDATAASLVNHPLFDCLPEEPTVDGALFRSVWKQDAALQFSWSAQSVASFEFVDLETGELLSPGWVAESFSFMCPKREVRQLHYEASQNELASFRFPCRDETSFRTTERHQTRKFITSVFWESYRCRFALNRPVYFEGTPRFSCSELPVHMAHETMPGEISFDSTTTGLAAWAVALIVLVSLLALFGAIAIFIHTRRQSSPNSLRSRTRKHGKEDKREKEEGEEEEEEEEVGELELSEVKAVMKVKPQASRPPRARPGLPPGEYVMVLGKDGTPVMKRSW